MNKSEALKKRPCYLCVHYDRCKVVDYLYSPCYETDKNGNEHHGAFELDTNREEESE